MTDTASQPIENVCILRLSAIGDVTHVLPVVHALQAGGCRVTWIIGRVEHKLLQGLPGVEFIVMDKRQGLSGVRRLYTALKHRRFDALLHMQVSLRANVVAWLVRAGLRVGYDRERARELHGLRLNRRIVHVRDQHVLDALSSFVEPLGLSRPPPRWNLPVADEDREFARRHVDPRRPTLVVTPCSSHRGRNWLPARYAAVIDHAAGRDWQVILCGGPSPFERDFADRCLGACRQPPLDLTGKDTLKELAGMLEAADLVLAPDTGPAHIANAMGTPVLGLYAATNPYRSGPYGSIELCVNRFPDAARRFRRREPESLRWGTRIEQPGVMALITTEEVIARFDEFADSLQDTRSLPPAPDHRTGH